MRSEEEKAAWNREREEKAVINQEKNQSYLGKLAQGQSVLLIEQTLTPTLTWANNGTDA